MVIVNDLLLTKFQFQVKYMLNSKKSSNSKKMSADQAFYYIHVTL